MTKLWKSAWPPAEQISFETFSNKKCCQNEISVCVHPEKFKKWYFAELGQRFSKPFFQNGINLSKIDFGFEAWKYQSSEWNFELWAKKYFQFLGKKMIFGIFWKNGFLSRFFSENVLN